MKEFWFTTIVGAFVIALSIYAWNLIGLSLHHLGIVLLFAIGIFLSYGVGGIFIGIVEEIMRRRK